MIYKYDYNIQKEVKNNNLYKIDKGLYSDKEFVNPLEVILKKYPNAILDLCQVFNPVPEGMSFEDYKSELAEINSNINKLTDFGLQKELEEK